MRLCRWAVLSPGQQWEPESEPEPKRPQGVRALEAGPTRPEPEPCLSLSLSLSLRRIRRLSRRRRCLIVEPLAERPEPWLSRGPTWAVAAEDELLLRRAQG